LSQNPVTTFDLVDSNSMDGVGSLANATGRSFKPVFNGPGTFSFTLRLDDKVAYQVATRATGVLITRNSSQIWSGGVTNVVRSAASNTMQVTATGWLEELDHRFVRKDEEATLVFVNVAGGAIVAALVNACNAQQDTSLVTRPLRISSGINTDTQLRNRSYHVGDNYGASIRELSTIENGVDFRVDPLTRVLACFAPTSYADLVDVKFGWGIDPSNLSDVIETGDGTNLFNRENAVTSGGIVTVADDRTLSRAPG
jgi:hypothetical protein